MDTAAVASAAIGALDGLYLQWLVDKENFAIKKVGAELIDMILNGILTEKK
jgi:hypothetical protein